MVTPPPRPVAADWVVREYRRCNNVVAEFQRCDRVFVAEMGAPFAAFPLEHRCPKCRKEMSQPYRDEQEKLKAIFEEQGE